MLIIFLFLLIHALSPLLLGTEIAREYANVYFLCQFLVFVMVWFSRRNLLVFVSPIVLGLSYVLVSFFVSSLAFENGLVLKDDYLVDYREWRFTELVLCYVLLTSLVVFATDVYFYRFIRIYSVSIPRADSIKRSDFLYLFICVFIFVLFLVVRFDASLFGGQGDLGVIPKSIAALAVIYYLASRKVRFRFLFYLCLLTLFVSFSSHSKREAIFLVLPIIFLEVYFNSVKLNFRFVFLSTTMFLAVIYSILLMTIMRGHGDYVEPDASVFEAAPYVDDYLRWDDFYSQFFENIEVNATYFHSFQAVEYVLGDNSDLLLGESIIKFLALPIPDAVLSEKPRSVTRIYTEMRDPDFRESGGSWPPNLYAEIFWNFHFYAILVLSIISMVILYQYLLLLRWLSSQRYALVPGGLYFYMMVLFYFRGSGLDLFLIYVGFGFMFSISLVVIESLVKQRRILI